VFANIFNRLSNVAQPPWKSEIIAAGNAAGLLGWRRFLSSTPVRRYHLQVANN